MFVGADKMTAYVNRIRKFSKPSFAFSYVNTRKFALLRSALPLALLEGKIPCGGSVARRATVTQLMYTKANSNDAQTIW